MMYFGTDGIRGVANQQITPELAMRVGNALTRKTPHCRVVIGRDTRRSGSMLLHALAAGVMQGGGEVWDVDLMPTAAISYLTQQYHADFGVVISASHNPAEYNGIKLFDADGRKPEAEVEEQVEAYMAQPLSVQAESIGTYRFVHDAEQTYCQHLIACGGSLRGKRILLDCANGAAGKIAPQVMRALGAQVDALYTSDSGLDINDNCGALYPALLSERVRKGGYDMAFAFDGDSDRVIALDENGTIVDGDEILYILTRAYVAAGLLTTPLVVGTHHTNQGIVNALQQVGVKVLRADIGDKYVMRAMLHTGAQLGAEQSGHVILGDKANTGDGILTAVVLASCVSTSGATLGQCNDAQLYPQCNRNIVVRDRMRIINNTDLSDLLQQCRKKLGSRGRILVRASGTEEKIRIMAECVTQEEADKTCAEIADFVLKLEEE